MATQKSQKFRYGRDPNPQSWHEASDALKANRVPEKKPKKSSGVIDRLAAIEALLKAK